MLRLFLAVSIFANALLGVALYQSSADYGRLLNWACDHGNGGYECGED